MTEKTTKWESGCVFGLGAEDVLGETAGITAAPRKRGAAKEVERILLMSNKPLHLRIIMASLLAAGYTHTYQTMSGVLQILCKKKKVFKKVAPATYALIGYKNPVNTRIGRKVKSDPFSEKVVLANTHKEG